MSIILKVNLYIPNQTILVTITFTRTSFYNTDFMDHITSKLINIFISFLTKSRGLCFNIHSRLEGN